MLFSYLYFCLIIAYKMKTDLKIKSNLGEKVYLIIYFHLTLLREARAGVQRENWRKELKHRPGRNVSWLALFSLLSLLSPTSRRVACSWVGSTSIISQENTHYRLTYRQSHEDYLRVATDVVKCHKWKAAWKGKGLFHLHFHITVHYWRKLGQELKEGIWEQELKWKS